MTWADDAAGTPDDCAEAFHQRLPMCHGRPAFWGEREIGLRGVKGDVELPL